jgi:hypothetical protein
MVVVAVLILVMVEVMAETAVVDLHIHLAVEAELVAILEMAAEGAQLIVLITIQIQDISII